MQKNKDKKLIYILQNKRKEGEFIYPDLEEVFPYQPFYVGISTSRWKEYNISRLPFIKDFPEFEVKTSIKEHPEEKAYEIQREYIRKIGRYPDGPLMNKSNCSYGVSQSWQIIAGQREWIVDSLRKFSREHPEFKLQQLYSCWRGHNKGYGYGYPFKVYRLT